VIPLAEAVILIPWNAYNAEREAAAAEIARLQDRLAAWAAGAHADATGHLHACAKINGVWVCTPGCFWPELVTLRAEGAAAKAEIAKWPFP
jgi:hypothetical protein